MPFPAVRSSHLRKRALLFTATVQNSDGLAELGAAAGALVFGHIGKDDAAAEDDFATVGLLEGLAARLSVEDGNDLSATAMALAGLAFNQVDVVGVFFHGIVVYKVKQRGREQADLH